MKRTLLLIAVIILLSSGCSTKNESLTGNLKVGVKTQSNTASYQDFSDPSGFYNVKIPDNIKAEIVKTKNENSLEQVVFMALESSNSNDKIVFDVLNEKMEDSDNRVKNEIEYISRIQITYDNRVSVKYTDASNALQIIILPLSEDKTLEIKVYGGDMVSYFEEMMRNIVFNDKIN